MLSSKEKLVQEAIELISDSRVPNLVFASIFMSHQAIEAIVNALASQSNQVTRSLTFACVYFGTQPALSDQLELEQIAMRKQRSYVASPPQKNQLATHGMS